jgi:replicative DNA helicase
MLRKEDLTNLTYAAATLSKAPILIDDTPALSLREVRARARRFMKDKELFGKRQTGLIVIDYLQLMRGSPQAAKASREQEISEISRGLKSLAKELHCPVLALSQLNRSLEQRTDKRPQLSDLRESGAIEQDADVILFIYRDVVYHPDAENPNIAEVIIGKNRHGATGTIETHFEGRFTRFENVSRRDPPA